MKTKLTAIFVIAMASGQASALTIDYRHQYTDTGTNADRLLLSHRFANNIGVSLENTYRSGAGAHKEDAKKPYSEMGSNGVATSVNYLYKVTPNFSLQPAFMLEMFESKNVSKPSLKAQYNFTKDFYVSARYRYEYVRNTQKKGLDDHINRGDFWVGYNFGKIGVAYNYMYRKGDLIRANNKKYDDWHNIRLQYKYDKNWLPYVEVGNTTDTSNKTADGGRQTRFRIGVAYTF